MAREATTIAEQGYWTTAREVIRILGEDGMSSDESASEDGVFVFRGHALEWRRNLDRLMGTIDAARDKVFTTRGTRPYIRKRPNRNVALGPNGGTLRSTRKPKRGLPKALYDPNWFAGLTDQYIAWLGLEDVDIDVEAVI